MILGADGVGKTTLAQLAMGLLKPDSGQIIRAAEFSRAAVLMQQSRNQIIGTTVVDDLAFGLMLHNVPSAEIARKTTAYLEYFNLSDKRDCSVNHLSGSELKRLALAGALIIEPQLLVLDEPLGMLDFGQRELCLRALDELLPRESAVLWLDYEVRSVRYVDSLYLLSAAEGIRPLNIEKINQPDFVNENGLVPAPLQELEWGNCRIKKALWGPEKIEINA